MTDEQIKQNAEEYATELYGEYDEHDYTDHSGSNMCHAVSEKAFIAGAHSRDEEIAKLLNPWISVKERRPNYPESEYDIDNMYFVRREGSSMAFVATFRRNGKWYIYDNMQAVEIIEPDYWMLMPELKKGE